MLLPAVIDVLALVLVSVTVLIKGTSLTFRVASALLILTVCLVVSKAYPGGALDSTAVYVPFLSFTFEEPLPDELVVMDATSVPELL